MSSLTPPDQERRELIDKGRIKPDPARDLLTHEDWRAQGGFLSKVQQSWRRTMDAGGRASSRSAPREEIGPSAESSEYGR